MYGFGAEEGIEQAPSAEEGPQFYRDWMGKVSKQLQQLQDRNDALEAAQAKQSVKQTLTAQGYAPQVADLYTGKPEGLNDWLGTYGAALARGDAAPEGGEAEGQVQGGTPPTVVSSESQAAMAAISGASQGGSGPLSGEDQLAARLNAANTPEEFNAIMREAGNVRFR